MTQWERLQQLDTVYSQRAFDLYNGDEFPMEVRHYLAHWIEGQDWERASRDSSQAAFLFQVLLENLDNQFSRFVQEKESFLLQRNFRRYKQNFQEYQEEPYTLATIIHWFLVKEKGILNDAELAQQVQTLQIQPAAMELESQRQVEKRLKDLKAKVEVMEHSIRCLEEQQDEFDFKYQTHLMDSCTEEEKKKQLEGLQKMLNALDNCRKVGKFCVKLGSLINEELVEWKQRQQKSCIGAPDDTSLEHLEKWFTQIIECMFQLQKFLQKLDELVGKMTYENDPIPVRKPPLNIRVDTLLTHLIKSSFVVETQPSMPQGRGLLVLRTNVQFSVKVRLLYKVPELNHVMKVTVSIDKFRKFNVLGTLSKALNMAESMNGGMVADFRHLTLKDQKVSGGGKGINDLSLSVTEELHRINFQTQFDCQGLSVPLETSSLPVVVISNSSQQQSAWASVLWFNMLCPDPKNIKFFETSPAATWLQFGEMLSWQFLSCGKRGLDNDQLETLAIKLFGKQPSYDNCKITWTKFSKENLPDTNFTLWVWLDGILNLVKLYLSDLWSDGSIMGFISKGKERLLLKKKQNGTFLLRFSESIKDGGITFSWVQYANDATPSVQTVKPFTITDLKQIALPDILCNFRIMVAENIPVNPLCYLYPNTPKDQAFGKYYSEKTGEENPYLKYLKTKLVFVSKENGCSGIREGPESDLCTQDRDPPSFFDAGDDDDDVLLKVSKKSPMFSVSTIDADLLSSILDSDGESTVPHAFPPTSPRISPSCLQQSFPESAEYNLEEALSTDNDVNYTLQEFLNGINLHILQEEPDGFILDPGFQDLGNPNIPLTP
uniref:Signal transducer and activator of transcription n=1 Tax=Sinocyclocheilus grahami TaxID=75366 RepID=A0A672PXM4_SINGR